MLSFHVVVQIRFTVDYVVAQVTLIVVDLSFMVLKVKLTFCVLTGTALYLAFDDFMSCDGAGPSYIWSCIHRGYMSTPCDVY